jgi:hypothetical protein
MRVDHERQQGSRGDQQQVDGTSAETVASNETAAPQLRIVAVDPSPRAREAD